MLPLRGTTRTVRGTNVSAPVCTHTMSWLLVFLTTAELGTANPLTTSLVCRTTLTGWLTANCSVPLPGLVRNSRGIAPSRSVRPAPANCSATLPWVLAIDADAILPTKAASNALASTLKRLGSTISNNTSRASTTWPATTWLEAITPDTGATRASSATKLAPMASERCCKLLTSDFAASISLAGTVPSSCSNLARRFFASSRLLLSSVLCDCWLARSIALVDARTTASTSPLRTAWPKVGRPRGPASMRPAWVGCTLPPALASATTRPVSSTALGREASSTATVRIPNCRCDSLGKNTPPSAWRLGAFPLAAGTDSSPWSCPGPAIATKEAVVVTIRVQAANKNVAFDPKVAARLRLRNAKKTIAASSNAPPA